jgi:coenzyme PQQ precursor peptide PqqA
MPTIGGKFIVIPLVERPPFDLLLRCRGSELNPRAPSGEWQRKRTMAWTTPTLVEICIGLEINGYLPAEF